MNSDEIIRRGEEYRQMAETPGWKDLAKSLKSIIEGAKDQWLNGEETDAELKIYARAYRRVLKLVDNRIDIGKKRAEEKNNPPKPHTRARERKRKVIV